MDFMDTLDTLKDRAVDLAQAGVAQSKRLAEIAKLKMANVSEEDTIKRAYIEIGKLYYAEQGAAPDGAYAAACERITAARAAIETNKERIAELKQPDDPIDDEDETIVAVEDAPLQPEEPAVQDDLNEASVSEEDFQPEEETQP